MIEELEVVHKEEILCNSCQSPVAENARFCSHCGASIVIEKTPAENSNLIHALIIFYLVEFTVCSLVKFNDSLQELQYLLIAEGVMAISAIAFCLYIRSDVKPVLRWKSFSIPKLFLYAGIAIAASLVVHTIVSWLNRSLFDSDEYYYYAFSSYDYPILYMLLFVAVSPALFEEIAYRGFVLGGLLKLLDKTQAIFLSAFVFALIHLSIISFFWLLPFAILLGYVRTKENTIWYGVIIHFCFNATSCLLEVYDLDLF